MRTPLLPFDELLRWSEELQAPAARNDPARFEQALAADRERLRERLFGIVSREEVRDAIFVASPDLDDSLDVWLREPESERGQRIERALVRYFARMAGRATPFGLFAGTSVGTIASQTQLTIGEHKKYKRHTRLDMDYLYALAESNSKNPEFRNLFRYRPNSSLYSVAGRLRYVESHLQDKVRSFRLTAIEKTDYLEATLTRSQSGASFAELTAPLADEDVSMEEAEEYIGELIESQVLIPDLQLTVTGPEPIHPLIERLQGHAETSHIAGILDQIRSELYDIDAGGLGAKRERYRGIAQSLSKLPAKVELPRLYQVDLMKPAIGATLGNAVLEEIERGVEILRKIRRRSEPESLKRFREAFRARYEGREVPLVEALDEESGVGFEATEDTSPLLQGLPFPTSSDDNTPWSERENFLLRKLSEILQSGASELSLDSRELETLSDKNSLQLPDAFAVIAAVAATSQDALAKGDFRVLISTVSGPSGASLLGRFCHADGNIATLCGAASSLRRSAAPRCPLCRIVTSAGRTSRQHPVPSGSTRLRNPYLGHPGVPPDRQILVTDLRVSVNGERVLLRSAQLGREIIPRMTNAHNFKMSQLGIYRFLCVIQHQQITEWAGWDWGILRKAPFLPRVTAGRLVFFKARWRLTKEEIRHFAKFMGRSCSRRFNPGGLSGGYLVGLLCKTTTMCSPLILIMFYASKLLRIL